MKQTIFALSLILAFLIIYSCSKEQPTAPGLTEREEITTTLAKKGGSGDPAVLAMMADINGQLASQGLNMAVESIEFFTIGQGRPSARIHQQPFRWVPNDARRGAQGTDITHLLDDTYQGTTSGVSASDTKTKIRRALRTWNRNKALRKVEIVELPDPGSDPTIFDEFFPGTGDEGTPTDGFPFFADIVNAGWYPRALFEAVGGPGGGRGILAFSVTFIFTNPSDINGDGYLDTALNEVYYNDTFGDPGDDRAGNPWGCDIALPGIDIETVALHENGHSLELGHFGPPPDAVMNPIYAGILQSPLPSDRAGMQAVWGSWPNL